MTAENIRKLYWAYIRSLCSHDRIIEVLSREYGSALVLEALKDIRG